MSSNGTSATTRERMSSPLAFHIAGVTVLLIVAIVLAVRLGLDWAAMHSSSSDAYAARQVQLKALEIQAAPLRGLDQRVSKSRDELASFEQKRIPPTYSSISSRIGELAVASGVRLTRMQYTQGAPGVELTEITIDTSISGDYSAIMRFVNSLERDPIFFIIRAMSLTGQQGGLVNLRLGMSTWLRPGDVPSELPTTPKPGSAPAQAPTGREGM